ncbi:MULTISPECIES: AAA-like domain-containing protein [unclassified Nodularia (in: cyanobacteria)]|uniref:WD40 domain-containing protein n=1 Tax=unclassified Nodularia (in: cyanobacteria) TaxID=2656917 RepID=UPI001880E6D0|nr:MULTISPECIES: AAA-like domain-containing protein [unclassified Nodularia (in: cyanobacteria)]MBE9198467.1 AAA-like domain-containing protein [Nodularia sp. LEGE 06071]MCC2691068.1 AAA-like domain-containing protein [Nodularia sp. LEGE 04288]
MVVYPSPDVSYQVGGSLPANAASYVRRGADEVLFQGLLRGEFCYVFNARQMGKSSLRVQTTHRLQAEGVRCGVIDITAIGTREVTPEQWYASIIGLLVKNFGLNLDLGNWWRDRSHLSLINRLSDFFDTVLLRQISAPIVIFIDEIDSVLSLKFATDDFFALIRAYYNRRAEQPEYFRLSFALFGVATPGDLIADTTRTPFNIGQAIELQGFRGTEATPLLTGLNGFVSDSPATLQQILFWTGGQPFLTQKLCRLVVQNKADLVDHLVQTYILQNWESQDEPEHLKTIRDRLLYSEERRGRLLGLYQQILLRFTLDNDGIPADNSPEQTELILTGLVEKQGGILQVKNPIYQQIFDLDWVAKQLANIRPYSQAINGWMASGYIDQSWLLRGQALQKILLWTQGKSLNDLDYRFLAASQELERQEVKKTLKAERLREVQTRLNLELQRYLEQQQHLKRQRLMLGIVSVMMLVAITLGLVTYNQYQQTAVSEVKAIASAANGSFNSHQRLDALVQAIKARQKFKNLNFAHLADKTSLDSQTHMALQKAVYGADEVNRLLGHQGIVLSVDFSPDGEWIASSSVDRTVKLWHRDGTLVRTLTHSTTLNSVRFSPDSRLIAVAGIDGSVRLWTIEGKLLQVFTGHQSALSKVVFSPDGKIIASASGDRTIKLWELDGTLIKTLQHDRGVWGIAFNPDGKTIASSTVGGQNYLWQLDGTLIKKFTAGSATIWSLAWSQDGKTLVSGGADYLVRLWNQNGVLRQSLWGHTSEILDITISQDEQIIASASADKTVKLWRMDGTLIRTLQGHTSNVEGIGFSPDGQIIASAGHDNTIRLWRVHPPLVKLLNSHKGRVWRVAFSPDGKYLASVAGKQVKLWNQDGSLAKTIVEEDSQMLSLTFSPDSQTLAIVGSLGVIRLWQLEDNQRTIIAGEGFGLLGITYSPDSKFLATVGFDGKLRFWQRQANNQFQLYQTITAHSDRIWDIAYSPDGEFLASASADGTIKIWTIKNSERLLEKPLHTLEGHHSEVLGLAISPDSRYIASTGGDGNLRLWRRDGTLARVFSGDSIGFTRVAFSPDGEIVAAASFDNTIKVWKIDGTLLTTLNGHTSSVSTVAFSPDSKTLASGSDDQVVILWDLEQILNLDLVKSGCDWVEDYLRTNKDIEKSDRDLCHN